MDINTLDSIDSTQRGDPGNCLREMLAEWLRGAGDPPRTWNTIVAALNGVKGLEALAEDIEGKFHLGSSGSIKSTTKSTSPQGSLC